MERESARRSSLKGRERAIVNFNQTNIGAVQRQPSRDVSEVCGAERITKGFFRTHRYHFEVGGCRFTSTETVGLLGTGAQDGHLWATFTQLPELCFELNSDYFIFIFVLQCL